MPNNAIPCHLLVFENSIEGKHKIIITVNAIGTSTKSDELIPLIILDVGMLKGPRIEAIPVTKTTLKKFAPMTFPSDRLLCPLTNAVIAVESSGKDVPRARIVIAMTDSGTPNFLAIKVPLSTSRLDANAITAADTIIINKDLIILNNLSL